MTAAITFAVKPNNVCIAAIIYDLCNCLWSIVRFIAHLKLSQTGGLSGARMVTKQSHRCGTRDLSGSNPDLEPSILTCFRPLQVGYGRSLALPPGSTSVTTCHSTLHNLTSLNSIVSYLNDQETGRNNRGKTDAWSSRVDRQ